MKRFLDKAYVVIIAFLIISLSATLFIMPDKKFSEKENRTLSQSPEFSAEKLFSGEYTGKVGEYFADQFPLRNAFVCAKAYSELAIGKQENNGVIYAKDDTLVPREENDFSRLVQNLNTISAFAKRTGAELTVAVLPRTSDVFAERLPESYPENYDKEIWNEFKGITKALNLNTVDLYDELCESNAYYRTDHHYTTDGAYITYCGLSEKLGYTPKDKSFFKLDTVTKEFCGTAMRTSGFYFAKKDEINLYRYDNDLNYHVIADGKEIKLYDFSRLDSTDKYAVFLGGNHERVDITAKGENRERLLIIRDSFADSIAPFLSLHYDLTLIDLRYYNDSVSRILSEEKINKVLVMENISELATTKNISYLNMD